MTAYSLSILKYQSFIFRAFELLKTLIWKSAFFLFNLKIERRKIYSFRSRVKFRYVLHVDLLMLLWEEFQVHLEGNENGKNAVFVSWDPWQNKNIHEVWHKQNCRIRSVSNCHNPKIKRIFFYINTTMQWRHTSRGKIHVWYNYHYMLFFFLCQIP